MSRAFSAVNMVVVVFCRGGGWSPPVCGEVAAGKCLPAYGTKIIIFIGLCKVFITKCAGSMDSPFRKSKTSDFFDTKYGCFASKVRRFASKKSDVFSFRNLPRKKVFGSASIWVIIPVPFHVGIENFCP